MFKNALISVSDKTGLIDFIRPLASAGMRVVSTGGTAKHLRESGIEVVEVAEQTGFPEVMDGRVRTLHPNIHMPLLARLGVDEDMALLREHQLEPFDLIVVNLYPFANAVRDGKRGDELIEYIDIGGPSLLRAAAKNHAYVTVVADPSDYGWVLERAKAGLELADRRRLAAKVFSHTTRYDALIAEELSGLAGGDSFEYNFLAGDLVQTLRYGENPQQRAAWFKLNSAAHGLHDAEILHGKPLSYNNLLDLSAATESVRELRGIAAVAVKHNNPCGVAFGESVAQAASRCLAADPVSVFGGIVAFNRPLDLLAAEALGKIFLECIVAPDFSEAALERLRKKKDLRLLRWPGMLQSRGQIKEQNSESLRDQVEFRTVAGGYLVQSCDRILEVASDWKYLGERPTPELRLDLELAWRVCGRLKSNAIAIAAQGQSVGLGMGQVNRVDAVEQAISRMRQHHPNVSTPVLASDAFFPFADSIEKIHAAGIRWVVQPGGSIRDEEVFACARELGVNLVITGVRHFRH